MTELMRTSRAAKCMPAEARAELFAAGASAQSVQVAVRWLGGGGSGGHLARTSHRPSAGAADVLDATPPSATLSTRGTHDLYRQHYAVFGSTCRSLQPP